MEAMTLRIPHFLAKRLCSTFHHALVSKRAIQPLLVNRIALKYSTDSSTISALPNCNVGTIGHVDHGKTTLTAAITKYCSKRGSGDFVDYDQIDRAPEEKSRGVTINIAHVGYRTKIRRYAHTDCPGHADYVKNMISGTSQMDGAILVVAATDGQMPQTRQHLLLAKQIGLKDIIVFINKADLVDRDILELVELEMREVLTDYKFDGEKAPMIYGSALLALNEDTSEFGEPAIQKLLDTLDTHFEVPSRDVSSPFFMAIDNSLSVPGRGVVIVGTVKRGTIRKKDAGVICGYNRSLNTLVNGMQVFHKNVDAAAAGDNVGILVKNIKLNMLRKGMVFCKPESVKLTNLFDAEVYLLTEKEGGKGKPLPHNYVEVVYSDSWHVLGKVLFFEGRELLMPGEYATVRICFMMRMPVLPNQRFTIRDKEGHLVATGLISRIVGEFNVPTNQMLHRVEVPIAKEI